jgi:hypothetical protein
VWLEGSSCVLFGQCLGEEEHVQNEVHAVLFCQDHQDRELRKYFSIFLTPVFEDFSTARPYMLRQVNNRLVPFPAEHWTFSLAL